MNDLANHLWQSTIFTLAVALTTFTLRRNSARLRYWLWLAGSVKYVIPISTLVSMGGRVVMPPDTPQLSALTVTRVSTYFAPAAAFPASTLEARPSHWLEVLAAIWLTGSVLLVLRWFRRWYKIHRAVRGATPFPMQKALPVLSLAAMTEPAIFGIFRPVLLLPQGIVDKLSPEQFEAVLAHELCHVRYRDNLTAALHMCVETIFWFHPLVWWIGAKLIEERERDCDESVLRQGSRPGDYAQAIINICKSFINSPFPCAAGITGASLNQRIREIMTWRGSLPVSFFRKMTLAAMGVVALAVPFMIGIIRAQTLPPAPAYSYDVVSIHPSKSARMGWSIAPGAQGGLRMENVTAMDLLMYAYQLRDDQIAGAPRWATSDRFDINFTPEKPEAGPGPDLPVKQLQASMNRNQQRSQAVLQNRFGLILRTETHQLPTYALILGRKGPKLSLSEDRSRGVSVQDNGDQITATGATIQMLADRLSVRLHRQVIDDTGLDGQYDFKLKWTPDSPVQVSSDAPSSAAAGPSLVTALNEQLGLRLESRRGPVTVYVIEKIEKPGEN